ncbi:MAG: PHP domain-containing protein [Bacillota bacterium]|nr:PHP domain-containing protein [Bacillota bacterium]
MLDLHIHTTASDGSESPKDMVRLAYLAGIDTMAITDHDTMDGCLEAMEEGKKLGVHVIPGMEISAGYRDSYIHILGYGMNPSNPELLPIIQYVRNDRKERNQKIIVSMEQDGIVFSEEDLNKKTLGRPHFAKVLVDQGRATDIQDAFDRFLGNNKKYSFPRNYISLAKSIEIIHACQGLVVVAHPYQYKFEDLTAFLEEMVSLGVDGVEVYYSGYSEEQIAFLKDFATRHQLLITGGSDFHGDCKPNILLGALDIPDSCKEAFMNQLEARTK